MSGGIGRTGPFETGGMLVSWVMIAWVGQGLDKHSEGVWISTHKIPMRCGDHRL